MPAYNRKVTFRKLRKAALVSAVSGLALFGSMTYSHAEETARYQFNIEAQPLAKALMAFSKQTNINIVASGDLVAGRVSGKANGDLSATEALKSLLQGTGVAFEMRDDNTLVIRKSGEASGHNGPANSQDIGKMAPEANGSMDAVSWGTVTGTVTDERSGSALVGALVRIVDTDRAVATDDKGNFRFPKVRSGAHTVSISYLGYRGMEVEITLGRNETAHNSYTLGGVTAALEEVVIFGSRSARARALNQERLAENSSSVISSDQMGDFVGTTLAEALRRVPGVTFQRDPATGTGTNIMVRGASPDFNAVKLNGLNLAATDVSGAVSRSANLNNILADSVEKVTIHKTLLPSHDSAGTGGLIEIETKSPLSRAAGHVNLSVERGLRTGDFSDDFLLSGTFSDKFGSDERFGVSASVQYRKTNNTSFSLSKQLGFGSFLPIESGGAPVTQLLDIDPRLTFPFVDGDDKVYTTGTGNGFSRVEDETLAFTLSTEWQVTDNTEWRVDLLHSRSERDRTSRSFSLQQGDIYQPDRAGPGARYLLTVDDGNPYVPNFFGPPFDPGATSLQSSAGYTSSIDEEDVTGSYSFRGTTRKDLWEFNYTGGYSTGKSAAPNSRIISLTNRAALRKTDLLAEAVDVDEGRIVSPFGRYSDGYQLPLLTEAGFAALNNPANSDFAFGSDSSFESSNRIYEAQVKAKREIEHKNIKYIEFGLEYKNARSRSNGSGVSYFGIPQVTVTPGGPPFYIPNVIVTQPNAAQVGLELVEENLSPIGIDRGLGVITSESAAAFFENAASLATGANPILEATSNTEPMQSQAFLQETSLVAYIQGRLEFGKLEIIGGARLDRVSVNSAQVFSPTVTDQLGAEDLAFRDRFATIDVNKATVATILPRVSFNYRENDNLVFRGGYYLSVARPSIPSLSSRPTIALNLNSFFGQPTLDIGVGNPGLKPALTHNFDFSAEYYDDQIGVIKLGVFYKSIKNLLQQAQTVGGVDAIGDIALPDDPYFDNLPANLLVTVNRTENNPKAAEIWGVEAAFERQFTSLPGVWGGVGVRANYTYTGSSRDFNTSWRGSPVFNGAGAFIGREEILVSYTGVPFAQQVPHSGTAALTYNKYSIDASLGYTFQSRRLSSLGEFGMNYYNDRAESLDLRVEYRFGEGDAKLYRVYFEGADLLKGSGDPSVSSSRGGNNGMPQYITNSSYLGGRSFKLGLTAAF